MLGVTIAATGLLVLFLGKLYYQNIKGRPFLFSPFSLIVGALIIVLALRLGPRR
jgi:hypothetical protein